MCFVLAFAAVIRLMADPGWAEPGRTMNTQRHRLSAPAGRSVAVVILSQLPGYLRILFYSSLLLQLKNTAVAEQGVGLF